MGSKILLIPLIAIFAWGGSAATSRADDRYYLVVLAAQAEPNLPRLSHSFAVFVKASGDAKHPEKNEVAIHTISWLPASRDVHLLPRVPEEGKNMDLTESLKWARSRGDQIRVWGPYTVKKELYDLALKQIDRLGSGKIGYVALDGRFRDEGALNCIHAISDLDTTQPMLDSGLAHGNAASAIVVQHLSKWFVPRQEDSVWLRQRLGLQDNRTTSVTNSN